MDNPRGDGAASSDPRLHPGPAASCDQGPVLALEGVSARYPHAAGPALSGAHLYVGAGDVVALIGANGAGKSTLLRVAAGLLEPSGGVARVCGLDLRGADRREVARLVGFVPQSELVPWGFRVREAVAMGRAPHQASWMRQSAKDRDAVERALVRCDLLGLADRAVETLSGGEQRRVSIARAVAQSPRLLLLDEPGAFLDVRHRLDLHQLLAEVASSDRIAVVVATHDLDAAARFASTIVLLRGGVLTAMGPPAEVLTPEQLRGALDAEIAVGLHAPSGRRYFVPL